MNRFRPPERPDAPGFDMSTLVREHQRPQPGPGAGKLLTPNAEKAAQITTLTSVYGGRVKGSLVK